MRSMGFVRLRTLGIGGVLAALLIAGAIAAPPELAHANTFDEVLVFDSVPVPGSPDIGPSAEGLTRQRLGLLNTNGKPDTTNTGALVPLVSKDGTKKGFDMAGGNGTAFRAAFDQLKPDGGTFTVITHGSTGALDVEAACVEGFGEGTGLNDNNCEFPYQLDGAGAKKNVTNNLVVCKAADDANGVTPVSETLKAEIQSLKGSVSVTVASKEEITIRAAGGRTPADGLGLEDLKALVAKLPDVDAAIKKSNALTLPFADQYRTLQQHIDAAVGPKLAGKLLASIQYSVFNLTGFTAAGPAGIINEDVSTCLNCDSCPIGGHVGLFDAAATPPVESTNDPASPPVVPIAATVAAAAALAAGGWFVRRRRMR